MTATIGQPAPAIRLQADDGSDFDLADLQGRKVLLVFYPGDETPVCTRQLCDYRDGAETFDDLGVEVVGISPDGVDSHTRFKARHGLPFKLLADPGLEVAGSYGARGMLGMKRAVFLVDEAGVLRWAHIESVSLFRRQRDELLEVIRGLDDA